MPVIGRRGFLGLCVGAVVAACSRGSGGRSDALEDHVPGEPLYVEEARAYLVDVPEEHVDAALEVYPHEVHEGLRNGLLALSQRCPADACRVVFCSSSGWFGCSCDASLFTRTGAWRVGPAPRGMDLHPIQIDHDGQVAIDSSRRVEGLARGAFDVGPEPTGPHCIGASS